MKILHTGSLDIKSGGPALSTSLTIKGLIQFGVETEIITQPCTDDNLIAHDIPVHFTEKVVEPRYGYILNLKDVLKSQAKGCDIIHVQGLWQYLGHGAASFARKNKIPYVMTLRGMLYPQALAHSALIKKISLLLYQRKDLQQAACIQVTCKVEMDYYRALGFTNPVAIIPNPIETNDVIERIIEAKQKRIIGYLGRVHPRKRIERLIYAFDALRAETANCELLIIGADDVEYEYFLKQEVERLNLTNVRFTGFLSGEAKDKAICSLSYLVVPSDFENFGNIVTEALVRGVPVIASKGTPWQTLETFHCGWWIDNSQECINAALKEALDLPENKRIQMGENGKKMIKENYSVEVLGVKMKQLYDWILNKGERPEFVYLCN